MQTWIVTGASRGLGRALCHALAARGRRVVAIARDAEALAALAETLGRERLQPCVLDLADGAAIAPTLAALLPQIGELEGAINNAGIGGYKPFLEHDEAELARLLQVNLLAPMQVCRALLPRLLAQGHGHLVAIGSDLARRPFANMAPYVASKHGLAGFCHSLLREVKGRGVRVSLINPGIIDTGFGGGLEGEGDGVSSLSPAVLAKLVVEMVLQPAGVVVDELTVHPLGQATF
jgi:short-subunit dehydrogenase